MRGGADGKRQRDSAKSAERIEKEKEDEERE
jgi:hypothetical protein